MYTHQQVQLIQSKAKNTMIYNNIFLIKLRCLVSYTHAAPLDDKLQAETLSLLYQIYTASVTNNISAKVLYKRMYTSRIGN